MDCLLWLSCSGVIDRETVVYQTLPIRALVKLKKWTSNLLLHFNGKSGVTLLYVVLGEMTKRMITPHSDDEPPYWFIVPV